MARGDHYNTVKDLTENAVEYINSELDGNYRGYTGANAVSFYLDENHGVNVTCDNEAERAFNDVLCNEEV